MIVLKFGIFWVESEYSGENKSVFMNGGNGQAEI